MSWWHGTWLVARRSLVENLQSRTFKVVTGLLLLLSIGGVVIPQIIGESETSYTLATVGEAPATLRAALEAASEGGDFTVAFETRDSAEAVRLAVRDEEATAGLADGTLYTPSEAAGPFPVFVAQAVVAVETAERLAAAGLSPEQIASVQSVAPPRQESVGRVDSEGRAGVGFGVGIVLYLAITFAGSAIATTVAMEKASRISEVLLAVLRPTQILVGTVLAVGLVTLTQLLILAAPLAVAVRVTDLGLPKVASGDLALAVVWFVLGFALYAFLFAATAALVDKITEANSAILPVTLTLVVVYMLSITIVMGDPRGVWTTVLSIFPLSAPVAMPIRWAGGEVPIYQLLLAMGLTVATAVLLVAVSAAIYRRALLITGHRVTLREVLRAGRS
ncbi:ABC transporter permease [Intrasporangium sp.]|uniref:ABC transporter permease n=1 Tax=Intrasporangium sp. TaxID=1925024 RepID=UPI00293B7BB4|nr:ABC transporter permease [Intrasporangium sp.]MDV3222926.1 ABC transporter permease [Intrasporangium sp.]